MNALVCILYEHIAKCKKPTLEQIFIKVKPFSSNISIFATLPPIRVFPVCFDLFVVVHPS